LRLQVHLTFSTKEVYGPLGLDAPMAALFVGDKTAQEVAWDLNVNRSGFDYYLAVAFHAALEGKGHAALETAPEAEAQPQPQAGAT
jgi:hypothetical protein